MKRLLSLSLMAIALIAGSLFTSAPAFAAGYGTHSETQNGVTCKTWVTTSNTYPADDAHYWVCATSTETVNLTRADVIATTVEGWGNGANIRDWLGSHQVYYYYFQTQADTNNFFNGKYSGHPGSLISTTARCGNTATPAGTGVTTVISEIYDTCTYTGTPQNPDLAKVTAHESGHAFDFAYGIMIGGSAQNAQLPSQSAGFKQLANTAGTGDIQLLTPTNWTSLTQTQQVNYICNIYGVMLRPTALEQSLGVFNEFVCLNSTTVADNSSMGGHNFTTMTPTQIAQYRAPYFTLQGGVTGAAPAYEDLFAELFSLYALGTGPNGILAETDRLLSTGSSPRTDFLCTGWVVREYWFTKAPPPAPPSSESLPSRGCPNIAPGQLQ